MSPLPVVVVLVLALVGAPLTGVALVARARARRVEARAADERAAREGRACTACWRAWPCPVARWEARHRRAWIPAGARVYVVHAPPREAPPPLVDLRPPSSCRSTRVRAPRPS